ncbi:MAG: putative quinol monooxygenase [Dehalococcoidia bacterium]|jgi:quinol monooxygenase YgiN
MIIITAMMRAKEGQGDELAKVIKNFAPKFLKDPGCIDYNVQRRADNRNVFLFYERYEDDKALAFHSTAPHFKEMFTAMKPFLEGKAEISMYEEI